MLAYDVRFTVIQGARLAKDRFVNSDAAQVVEPPGIGYANSFGLRQVQ